MEFTKNIWDIKIIDTERKSFLETKDFIVLYGGDVQQILYKDAPKNQDMEYIIFKILVEKSKSDISTFNIQNIKLIAKNNDFTINKQFEQISDVVLENHKLKPFCKNTITFGKNEGYIIFEIDKNINLDDLYLNYNNTDISIINFENNNIVHATKNKNFNTNISISENIINKQNEIELQILEDYNLGNYSILNPYISINPYKTAPLTALLMFNSSKLGNISITVKGKDEYSTINHTFNDIGKSYKSNFLYEIPIIGLYENFKNTIEISIHYEDNTFEQNTIFIQTETVSNNIGFNIDVEIANTKLMETGFTFFADSTNKQYIALDCNSEIRYIFKFYNWEIPQLFHQLKNGNFLLTITSGHIFEIHLIGKIYSQYKDLRAVHHDTIALPNGNILNTSHSDINTKYKQDGIIELNYETGEVVNDIDLKNILNKDRFNKSDFHDWLHMNSLFYCENDESLVISARHQGVFKISYPECELKWITSIDSELDYLGDKYLKPIGSNFKPPVGQHSATILNNSKSKNKSKNKSTTSEIVHLLVFDNNCTFLEMPNFADNRKYSCISLYEINEKLMTIERIWSYGEDLGEEFFCERVCNTSMLSNDNLLITFGHRDFEIAKSGNLKNTATIMEISKNTKEIIYKVHIKLNSKNYIYRSERVKFYNSFNKFTIINSKGEIKKQNNYEERQTDITFNNFNFDFTNHKNEININSQIINIILDDSHKTLDIKGFNMLENLNSNNYNSKLIFINEYNNEHKSIDLKHFILSEMFKQIFKNQNLQNIELYENCMFSISIPFDKLKKYLSSGKYNIGLFIECCGFQTYKKYDYYIENINDGIKNNNKDNLTQQAEILEEIDKQFKYSNDKYTLDNPFIVLNPFNVSPLTALLGFNTTENGNLEITIKSKDINENNVINTTFNNNTNQYLVPIYGLYADFNNEIIIKFTSNSSSNAKIIEKSVFIKTDPLPENIPAMKILDISNNIKNEIYGNQKNTLIFATSKYYTAYDYNGNIRWYLSNDITLPYINCICKLKNGNLLIVSEKLLRPLYYSESIYEIDMTGKIYNEYFVKGVHHEIKELKNGDLLVACESYKGYENARDTVEDMIVRLDRKTGHIIDSWDMAKILDIELIADPTYTSTYLQGRYFAMKNSTEEEVLSVANKKATTDWFHMNSFTYNEDDDYFIVSGRMKDSIVKFSGNTKELIWILCDINAPWSGKLKHKFLKPIGENFEYSYGQHNIQELENNTILLFDNGNFRTKSAENILPANNNYSRAVCYKINEIDMTIEQVWEYGKKRGSDLYSCYLCGVQPIKKNHYLINFGGIVVDDCGDRYNIPAAIEFTHKNVQGKCVIVEVFNDIVIKEMELINNNNTNTYRVEYLKIYD